TICARNPLRTRQTAAIQPLGHEHRRFRPSTMQDGETTETQLSQGRRCRHHWRLLMRKKAGTSFETRLYIALPGGRLRNRRLPGGPTEPRQHRIQRNVEIEIEI